MPETMTLAMRVKEYRKSRAKSQLDMAFEMGISVEEISRIERGITDPRLSTLQKIAAHMWITVSDLLEFEQTERR